MRAGVQSSEGRRSGARMPLQRPHQLYSDGSQLEIDGWNRILTMLRSLRRATGATRTTPRAFVVDSSAYRRSFGDRSRRGLDDQESFCFPCLRFRIDRGYRGAFVPSGGRQAAPSYRRPLPLAWSFCGFRSHRIPARAQRGFRMEAGAGSGDWSRSRVLDRVCAALCISLPHRVARCAYGYSWDFCRDHRRSRCR